MLHHRLGVPVPLEDDALRLVVVEVDLVLQGSCVLVPHDLHQSSRQALEVIELALVELKPTDALNLADCAPVHGCLLIREYLWLFAARGNPSSPCFQTLRDERRTHSRGRGGSTP